MTRADQDATSPAPRKLIPCVIQRDKWLRGLGSSQSRLLKEYDNTMCCLGFACKALGFTDDEIRSKQTPADIVKDLTDSEKIREGIKKLNTAYLVEQIRSPATGNLRTLYDNQVCHKAMSENDRIHIRESLREAEIKTLGIALGFDFTFADGPNGEKFPNTNQYINRIPADQEYGVAE